MRGLSLVVLLALAMAAPAGAQGPREVARLPACFEAFANLPTVAERLGVQPGRSISGAVVLTMCDGRQYDFLALVNALLDRMEKAASEPAPSLACKQGQTFTVENRNGETFVGCK